MTDQPTPEQIRINAERAIAEAEAAMGVKMEWFWTDGQEVRFGALCCPLPEGPGIYHDRGSFIDAIVEIRA